VPILATEWEWDDAGIAWRFKIREGVKFHEGGDLTPEDVEYSFERALVQDRSGGPIWMLCDPLLGEHHSVDAGFAAIDAAVEVDGDSVVFYLVDSTWRQRFLLILCGPWASIVDKEWCVANDEWDGTEQTWRDYNKPDKADDYLYNHTNGTGPWKLEEWDMGVQIELVRNDAYWREPAAFETVTTQFVEDWAIRREALLAGDADLVHTTRSWDYGELEGVEALEDITDLNVYRDLPGFVALALSFNMGIAGDSSYIGSGALDGDGIPTDFFADIDVRKGFCYAFDYETYIEDGWAGQAQQLGSPVIEGLAFHNPDASAYSLDLDKAEEHLQAAWSGEVWEKGFKFTLVYDADFIPPKETACRILAENLLTINPKFEISIQSMDFGSAQVPNMVSRVLPVFLAPWSGDWPHPNNFVVPFMASDGIFADWQSYGSSELDELIENALREPNPTVQQYLYYAIQERYYEDAPSTALVQPLGRRYFTKYIEGFYYHPMIPGRAGPLYHMSKSES
jgi:peptide/nickel transport system substrate-binding protein